MTKLYYPICFLFIVFSSARSDTEVLAGMESATDASRGPSVITSTDGLLIPWEGTYTIGNYNLLIKRDGTRPYHLIEVCGTDGNVIMTTSIHRRLGSVQAILGTYTWQAWIFLFGEAEEKYALNEMLYINVDKPGLSGCVIGHHMSFSPSKNRVAYSKFVPRTLLKETKLPQVFIHDFSRGDYVIHYPPSEWADDQGHIIHKEGVFLTFDEEPGDEYIVGARLQYFPSGDANDKSDRWSYHEPQSGFIWSKCSNQLAFLSECTKENRTRCGTWLTIVDFDNSQEEPNLSRHLLSGDMRGLTLRGAAYTDFVWIDDENLLLTDRNKGEYIISVAGEVRKKEIQEGTQQSTEPAAPEAVPVP